MDNLIVEKLIEFGRLSWEKNFTPGISGNISARSSDGIIITSSGVSNGFLSKEDFSLIDYEGNLISGNKKPSSERFLHLAYYKKRCDVNAVFHYHSPSLTAFATSDSDFNINASPEMIYCFNKVPKARYAIPGSQELVEETGKFFEEFDVVLMENHGVITGAKDIKNAFLNIELCESYAKMLIESKILGNTKFLTQNEVDKIQGLKKNN